MVIGFCLWIVITLSMKPNRLDKLAKPLTGNSSTSAPANDERDSEN